MTSSGLQCQAVSFTDSWFSHRIAWNMVILNHGHQLNIHESSYILLVMPDIKATFITVRLEQSKTYTYDKQFLHD